MSQQTSTAGRSPALKFLLIAFLTILMCVPLFMINAVVWERSSLADMAASDIAQGWGGAQTVAGPVLAVPYIAMEKIWREGQKDTIQEPVRRWALFLPEDLAIEAGADAATRARGIFDVTVYESTIKFAGAFGVPDFTRLGVSPASIEWSKAVLFATIQDVRGIAENVTLTYGSNGVARVFEPGLGIGEPGYNGIHAKLDLTGPPTAEIPFSFTVRLNGTGELSFVPVGKDSTVDLKSSWPHPSFRGAFLPASRTIDGKGFSARWSVPYLRRSLPQEADMAGQMLGQLSYGAFGVTFFKPVDFYSLTDRALKYAVLFVGLVFLAFFLIELISGARLHAMQYLLIGLAQAMFYLLLLALAEQVGFSFAYLAAGAATVALTGLYAASVLKSRVRGFAAGAALSAIYGLLFFLLGEEDYALLTGSVALFLALATTMFVTRGIDWYQSFPRRGALEPAEGA